MILMILYSVYYMTFSSTFVEGAFLHQRHVVFPLREVPARAWTMPRSATCVIGRIWRRRRRGFPTSGYRVHNPPWYWMTGPIFSQETPIKQRWFWLVDVCFSFMFWFQCHFVELIWWRLEFHRLSEWNLIGMKSTELQSFAGEDWPLLKVSFNEPNRV